MARHLRRLGQPRARLPGGKVQGVDCGMEGSQSLAPSSDVSGKIVCHDRHPAERFGELMDQWTQRSHKLLAEPYEILPQLFAHCFVEDRVRRLHQRYEPPAAKDFDFTRKLFI